MLAQRAKHNHEEPETLKRHREMYQKRLRHLQMTQGKTEREVAEKANNPRVYRKASESNQDHQHEPLPPATIS